MTNCAETAHSPDQRQLVDVAIRHCRTFWKNAFENSALLGILIRVLAFLGLSLGRRFCWTQDTETPA